MFWQTETFQVTILGMRMRAQRGVHPIGDRWVVSGNSQDLPTEFIIIPRRNNPDAGALFE